MPRLKRAIAALYDGSVAPEMVISVHGGTGANSIVCQALCGPGMNVVCVLPSYQQHYSIPAALGSEVRVYNWARARNTAWTSKNPRDGRRRNEDDMPDVPGNPTGYCFTREELEEIAATARGVGAYVLCDEIYRGLSGEYMPSMCDIYEKAIVTSSTSKVFQAPERASADSHARPLGKRGDHELPFVQQHL